jgi:alkylation response protein AidB-like acyl-CoA dehydrogenase
MSGVQSRAIFEPSHELFRESFRTFLAKEVLPCYSQWEQDGIVDRAIWIKAGQHGFLGLGVPEEYGGAGTDDFRYNVIIAEELARQTLSGLVFTMQNDVALPYFLHLATEEQKRRWLPGIVSGEKITAIAMTEPQAGSDLAGIRTRAVRSADGDEYIVNGAKTFISNGQLADLVIVVARTGEDRHRGLSLIVVEGDTPGFTRGRRLDKIGMHSQDTSELFFDDARVPAANLLGEENRGFYALVRNLAQERLSAAVGAVAGAESMLTDTLEYVKGRVAFGQPIGRFQNTRFVLAELFTEARVARVFIDHCITEHLSGRLSDDEAAMAKWWTTELQNRVMDRCLQLHGGYGYMNEYRVARAWRDSRVLTIAAGSTEIMKEIIGRSLGL